MALLDEVNQLLTIKMQANESNSSPPWPLIHAFIVSELEKADRMIDYKKPIGDAEELDRFLAATVQALSN